MEWLNLLSPKDFASFTPEEYKLYVKTLYFKKVKKTPSVRLKVKKPELDWSKTAKGNLSIKIRREPKFITSAELQKIIDCVSVDFTRAQVMKKLKKIEIREA